MASIADSYVAQRESRSQWRAVDELNGLSASLAQPAPGKDSDAYTPVDPIGPPDTVVPGKLQQRRATDDPLGRQSAPKPAQSAAGKVVDNLGEVVPSAIKGAHNAVMTAVDPLADFLDENVYDFSKNVGTYKLDAPETVTGRITEGISRFMTGFIPAARGLKAMGVSGGVTNPLFAGAVADFATRDGHEARLSDLWVSSGMPKNGFTDWLKSDKDDSEFMGRLKNTVEGAAIGVVGQQVANGVVASVKAARTVLKQSRAATGAKAEMAALKDKYGELTTDDVIKYFGDASLPVVETRAKAAVAKGAAPKLDPRALIRNTNKTPAAPPYYHGGAVKFDKFDESKIRDLEGQAHGFSFTKDKNKATNYAERDWATDKPRNGQVYEADLSSAKLADDQQYKSVVDSVGDDWGELYPSAKTKQHAIAIKMQGSGFDGVNLSDGDVLMFNTAKIVGQPANSAIKSEDFETYVNFARIDEPDQVKFVMGKMAEAMKGSVDEARRGEITQKATQKMADDLGMSVATLMERRKGQPMNAEETLAARQLWAASGEKLLEAAKAAAGPNAGDLDQFAFRRAMAVHSAIQNEVVGARTETARALAQWKIPAGAGVEKARAIEQIMSASGGAAESKELARQLSILAESGANPAAIARFVERGWGEKSLGIVKEVWINGLLSSPKTLLVVNNLSNAGVAMQQVYERAVAGGIRGLIGGDGVKAAESIAMLHGLKSSIRDAFRMAAISLKTGETGHGFSKIDVTSPDSISAESFNMSSETSMGKFVDFLGHVATVPGRLLGAEDEFFKTIGYRMEVHAQAFRQASSESLGSSEFAAKTRELVDNPPEHIRINSSDAAMYSTFTNEVGWFGKAIMNLRDSGSPIGQLGITLVLPFIRTPTNIARYTFERTPLAPLVGQWRADIAAGGARSDLALARMSTGTAIMMTAMDYANDGVVSGAGPVDVTEREALVRSGWQPYSMKVGDKWYSYSRADPFGSTMGLAASITEAVNRGEIDQEDADEWQEVTAMSIAAVAQVAINKTYMEGLSNAIEVMSDPKRYSEGYINNLFASFVPFTSLSAAVENVGDPTQREATTPWEAAEARIAGLSKDLPPRRNLWGEPIRNESGMGKVYDLLSPITVREQDIAPIDREIVRLGGGPQRIKKRTTFDGVSVSLKQHPGVYDEYVRLAGNDLKHPAWNMGAKDYLDAVVSGKHPMSPVWDMLPDEGRRSFIEGTVRDYRQLAQQQIMADPQFKKFKESLDYIKGAQQQSKMPVFGEQQ